jgi:hypothetical protein
VNIYERDKEYESQISIRLAPLRNALESDEIPVINLPKEGAEFTERVPGSVRIIVGHRYRGLKAQTDGQQREVEIAILVRLPNRYDDAPPEIRNPAVGWVEGQILRLLLGFVLPTALTPIVLVSGGLTPPQEGEWQREIGFKFVDFIPYEEEETPSLSQVVTEQFVVYYGEGNNAL